MTAVPSPSSPVAADERPLVELRSVSKRFDVSRPWLERALARRPRQFVHAVDDLSFVLGRGRTLALVGESGCGKSTVARLLVGLQRPTAGRIHIDGEDATDRLASLRDGRALRRRLQMIFQDPYASLNPRWTVGQLVAEPLVEHGIERDPRVLRERVAELLAAVRLDGADAGRYPHEFSGGQRQRISIARALAAAPELVVCDEPTSALDVSVQAQVLNLMKDLQAARRLGYLFISHNLAVVHHMADEVGVMYLGRLVEQAPRAALFARPRHPYTRLLLEAVPTLHRVAGPHEAIRGEPPDPLQPPRGCAFHPRCPHADARCRAERPALEVADDGGHRVACHAVTEGRL